MLIFHKPFTVHFQCVEGHDVKHVTWKAGQGLLPLLTFFSGSPLPAHGSCSTLTSPKQINQNDNLSKKHLKWELQDVLVSNSSVESEESNWWEKRSQFYTDRGSRQHSHSSQHQLLMYGTCILTYFWPKSSSKCHVTESSGASGLWHHDKADKLMAPQEHRH